MKVGIEKVVNLQLTEEEALDLRTILHNHIEEYSLHRQQEILIHKLKGALDEL